MFSSCIEWMRVNCSELNLHVSHFPCKLSPSILKTKKKKPRKSQGQANEKISMSPRNKTNHSMFLKPKKKCANWYYRKTIITSKVIKRHYFCFLLKACVIQQLIPTHRNHTHTHSHHFEKEAAKVVKHNKNSKQTKQQRVFISLFFFAKIPISTS